MSKYNDTTNNSGHWRCPIEYNKHYFACFFGIICMYRRFVGRNSTIAKNPEIADIMLQPACRKLIGIALLQVRYARYFRKRVKGEGNSI